MIRRHAVRRILIATVGIVGVLLYGETLVYSRQQPPAKKRTLQPVVARVHAVRGNCTLERKTFPSRRIRRHQPIRRGDVLNIPSNASVDIYFYETGEGRRLTSIEKIVVPASAQVWRINKKTISSLPSINYTPRHPMLADKEEWFEPFLGGTPVRAYSRWGCSSPMGTVLCPPGNSNTIALRYSLPPGKAGFLTICQESKGRFTSLFTKRLSANSTVFDVSVSDKPVASLNDHRLVTGHTYRWRIKWEGEESTDLQEHETSSRAFLTILSRESSEKIRKQARVILPPSKGAEDREDKAVRQMELLRLYIANDLDSDALMLLAKMRKDDPTNDILEAVEVRLLQRHQ